MRVDHVERARRAWPILVDVAQRRAWPLSYGELCQQLGVHPRVASYFLGVIQLHCELEGMPALQALAVNRGTGIPGEGYRGSAPTYLAHREAVERVYAHQWSKEPPAVFRGQR